MNIRKLTAAMAVAGAVCISPLVAAAEEPSREIKTGAASGLVIGAVTGGPIGAFAGTVLGGEVFGRLFQQRRENNELRIEVARLNQGMNSQHEAHASMVALLNEDLDKLISVQASQPAKRQLPVQFRTGSSDIETHYEEELEQIARVLTRNHDAIVNLTGYSDRRGDDTYNQVLSEKRVDAVEKFLLARGVRKQQILGMAYGETQPLSEVESLEDNFFDRRVVVELKLNIDHQLATR